MWYFEARHKDLANTDFPQPGSPVTQRRPDDFSSLPPIVKLLVLTTGKYERHSWELEICSPRKWSWRVHGGPEILDQCPVSPFAVPSQSQARPALAGEIGTASVAIREARQF